MKSILDWTATPLGTAVLGWLVLGLCTLIFKPRSPEQYAAVAARGTTRLGRFFWPRFAALWQLAGGLGIDPAKVAEALSKLITGKVKPLAIGTVAVDMKKDDESGPYRDGMLPTALLLCGALAILGVAPAIAACSSTPTTPAQTKAQSQEEANGAYMADMLKCVDKTVYVDLDASAGCSANVRTRWHRLPDGGADPAFNHDGGI